MDISISSISTNRRVGKALTRLFKELEGLRECAVDVSVEGFDVLQFVFVDGLEGQVEIQRTPKGSRLLQVHLGLPTSRTFRPDDDELLLRGISMQVRNAVKALGPQFPSDVLSARIEGWLAGRGVSDSESLLQ